MSEELKPVLCGCGGEAVLWHIEFCEQDLYLYHCMSCDTATKFYPSEEQAAAAWNTAMSGNRMHSHTVILAEPGEEAAKPYKVSKNSKRWHCGRCSTAVGRFWKFCQKCGTRIDWSVRNEDHLHE